MEEETREEEVPVKSMAGQKDLPRQNKPKEMQKKLVLMSMNKDSMIVVKGKTLGMSTEDKEKGRTNKDNNWKTDNNKDECLEREKAAYKQRED